MGQWLFYRNSPCRAWVVKRYLLVKKGINFSFSKDIDIDTDTQTTPNVSVSKIPKYFCTEEKCKRDD